MNKIKTYTLTEAKKALEHYCIYQDRCHKEVEEKLAKMRLIPAVIEEVITRLIAENFLNETRFSQSFARGKFRIKKWGKLRITRELKWRNITPYNIQKGLEEIDPQEYQKTLELLLEKKMEQFGESTLQVRKKKTLDYLMRQGFEYSRINDAFAALFP